MAGSNEAHDENEGNHVAHVTFVWTLIIAAAFVAAVFIFILR